MKRKGIFHSITGHEGPKGEYEYSSTLSLTSVLFWVGGQHHASAAFPQGINRYRLYRGLGGPQGRSGWVRENSLPTGLDSPTFQPIASNYTD
jgi:hypothetical protein